MRYLLLCIAFWITDSVRSQSTWKTYPAFAEEYAYHLLAGNDYSDLWLVYKSAEEDQVVLQRYNLSQELQEEHQIRSEKGLQLIQATRDRDRILVLLGNNTRADWQWVVFYFISGDHSVFQTAAYPLRSLSHLALIEQSAYFGLNLSKETSFFCLDLDASQIRALEFPQLRRPLLRYFQSDTWSGELHLSWQELNTREPTSVVVQSYRLGKLSRKLSLGKSNKRFRNASLLRNAQGDLFVLGSYALDISRRSVQGSFWARVSPKAQMTEIAWYDFNKLPGHPAANRKPKNKEKVRLITTPSYMQSPLRIGNKIYQAHIAYRPGLQEQYRSSTRPSSYIFEQWDLDYASILQFDDRGRLEQSTSVNLLDLSVPELQDVLSLSAHRDSLSIAYPIRDKIVWQHILPGPVSDWHTWPIPPLSKKAVLHRRVRVQGLRGGFFAASGYQVLHRGKKKYWWKVISTHHP